MDQGTYLTGQFLIAMPGMGDPNFDHTVTYICEHTPDGALGLVVNRPMNLTLGDVLAQMELEPGREELAAQPILQGGPVQPERGFVLHDSEIDYASTLVVADGVRINTSRDILEALASWSGPERCLFALGYAGWGEGQLETEMTANAWLTVPGSTDILFATPLADRWRRAAETIGVDITALSSGAGHA